MKTTPWFRYDRVGNAFLKEAIIEAINRCGVALEPAQKSPPMGSGLLLFDGMDAQLCEAVDRDTRHGFDGSGAKFKFRPDLAGE